MRLKSATSQLAPFEILKREEEEEVNEERQKEIEMGNFVEEHNYFKDPFNIGVSLM